MLNYRRGAYFKHCARRRHLFEEIRSDVSPSLHTVNLRVVKTKPREVELSVTKSDDGHWAVYITELVNLRNLKPLENRWPTEPGPVTWITLPPLEPGTPYRVRVRPSENLKEPPIWIDEATFETPGKHTAAILVFCLFVRCFFFLKGLLRHTPLGMCPNKPSGHCGSFPPVDERANEVALASRTLDFNKAPRWGWIIPTFRSPPPLS